MGYNIYKIIKMTTPEQPETWGEMCGDYSINRSGLLYIEKITRGTFSQITEYNFNAKEFKTLKAAQKALTSVREGFTNDPSKTLESQGWTIKAEYREA